MSHQPNRTSLPFQTTMDTFRNNPNLATTPTPNNNNNNKNNAPSTSSRAPKLAKHKPPPLSTTTTTPLPPPQTKPLLGPLNHFIPMTFSNETDLYNFTIQQYTISFLQQHLQCVVLEDIPATDTQTQIQLPTIYYTDSTTRSPQGQSSLQMGSMLPIGEMWKGALVQSMLPTKLRLLRSYRQLNQQFITNPWIRSVILGKVSVQKRQKTRGRKGSTRDYTETDLSHPHLQSIQIMMNDLTPDTIPPPPQPLSSHHRHARRSANTTTPLTVPPTVAATAHPTSLPSPSKPSKSIPTTPHIHPNTRPQQFISLDIAQLSIPSHQLPFIPENTDSRTKNQKLIKNLIKHLQTTTHSVPTWYYSPSLPVPIPTTLAIQLQARANAEAPFLQALTNHHADLVQALHTTPLSPPHDTTTASSTNQSQNRSASTSISLQSRPIPTTLKHLNLAPQSQQSLQSHHPIQNQQLIQNQTNQPIAPRSATVLNRLSVTSRRTTSTTTAPPPAIAISLTSGSLPSTSTHIDSNTTLNSQNDFKPHQENVARSFRKAINHIIRSIYLPGYTEHILSRNGTSIDQNAIQHSGSLSNNFTQTNSQNSTIIGSIANPPLSQYSQLSQQTISSAYQPHTTHDYLSQLYTDNNTQTSNTQSLQLNSDTQPLQGLNAQNRHRPAPLNTQNSTQKTNSVTNPTSNHNNIGNSTNTSNKNQSYNTQTQHLPIILPPFQHLITLLPWLQGFSRFDISPLEEYKIHDQQLHSVTDYQYTALTQTSIDIYQDLQATVKVDLNLHNAQHLLQKSNNVNLIQTSQKNHNSLPQQHHINTNTQTDLLSSPSSNLLQSSVGLNNEHLSLTNTPIDNSNPNSLAFPSSKNTPLQTLSTVHKFSPIDPTRFKTPINRFLAIISTYLSYELSLIYASPPQSSFQPFVQTLGQNGGNLAETCGVIESNGNTNGKGNVTNTILNTINSSFKTFPSVDVTQCILPFTLLGNDEVFTGDDDSDTDDGNNGLDDDLGDECRDQKNDNLDHNTRTDLPPDQQLPPNSLVTLSSTTIARRLVISLSNIASLFTNIMVTPTHPLYQYVMYGTKIQPRHQQSDHSNDQSPNSLAPPPLPPSPCATTPFYSTDLINPTITPPMVHHPSSSSSLPDSHSVPALTLDTLFPYYRPLFHRHSLLPLQHRFSSNMYVPTYNPLFDKFRPFTKWELKFRFSALLNSVEADATARLKHRATRYQNYIESGSNTNGNGDQRQHHNHQHQLRPQHEHGSQMASSHYQQPSSSLFSLLPANLRTIQNSQAATNRNTSGWFSDKGDLGPKSPIKIGKESDNNGNSSNPTQLNKNKYLDSVDFQTSRLDSNKPFRHFPSAIVFSYSMVESELRTNRLGMGGDHYNGKIDKTQGPLLYYEMVKLGSSTPTRERFFEGLPPLPSQTPVSIGVQSILNPAVGTVVKTSQQFGVGQLTQLKAGGGFGGDFGGGNLPITSTPTPHQSTQQSLPQYSPHRPYLGTQSTTVPPGTTVPYSKLLALDKVPRYGPEAQARKKSPTELHNERYANLMKLRNLLDSFHPLNNLDLGVNFTTPSPLYHNTTPNMPTQRQIGEYTRKLGLPGDLANLNHFSKNHETTSTSPFNIHQLPNDIKYQGHNPLLTSLQFYPYSSPIAQVRTHTITPSTFMREAHPSTTTSSLPGSNLHNKLQIFNSKHNDIVYMYYHNQMLNHPLYAFEKTFFECVGEMVLYGTHTDFHIPDYITLIQALYDVNIAKNGDGNLPSGFISGRNEFLTKFGEQKRSQLKRFLTNTKQTLASSDGVGQTDRNSTKKNSKSRQKPMVSVLVTDQHEHNSCTMNDGDDDDNQDADVHYGELTGLDITVLLNVDEKPQVGAVITTANEKNTDDESAHNLEKDSQLPISTPAEHQTMVETSTTHQSSPGVQLRKSSRRGKNSATVINDAIAPVCSTIATPSVSKNDSVADDGDNESGNDIDNGMSDEDDIVPKSKCSKQSKVQSRQQSKQQSKKQPKQQPKQQRDKHKPCDDSIAFSRPSRRSLKVNQDCEQHGGFRERRHKDPAPPKTTTPIKHTPPTVPLSSISTRSTRSRSAAAKGSSGPLPPPPALPKTATTQVRSRIGGRLSRGTTLSSEIADADHSTRESFSLRDGSTDLKSTSVFQSTNLFLPEPLPIPLTGQYQRFTSQYYITKRLQQQQQQQEQEQKQQLSQSPNSMPKASILAQTIQSYVSQGVQIPERYITEYQRNNSNLDSQIDDEDELLDWEYLYQQFSTDAPHYGVRPFQTAVNTSILAAFDSMDGQTVSTSTSSLVTSLRNDSALTATKRGFSAILGHDEYHNDQQQEQQQQKPPQRRAKTQNDSNSTSIDPPPHSNRLRAQYKKTQSRPSGPPPTSEYESMASMNSSNSSLRTKSDQDDCQLAQNMWLLDTILDPHFMPLQPSSIPQGLGTPFEHNFYNNRLTHPNLNPLRYNVMPCPHPTAILERKYSHIRAETAFDSGKLDRNTTQGDRTNKTGTNLELAKSLARGLEKQDSHQNPLNAQLSGTLLDAYGEFGNYYGTNSVPNTPLIGDGGKGILHDYDEYGNLGASNGSASATEEESSSVRREKDRAQWAMAYENGKDTVDGGDRDDIGVGGSDGGINSG